MDYLEDNMYPYRPYLDINHLVTYSIGLYAINLIERSVPENYAHILAKNCNVRRLTPEQVALNIFSSLPEAGSSVIVSSFLMGLAREQEPEIRPTSKCDIQMDLMMPFLDGFGS